MPATAPRCFRPAPHSPLTCLDNISHDHIARGFLDDVQRLQDRHTAGDERSQRAGEPGDGELAEERPQERRAQFEMVKNPPSRRGAQGKQEQGITPTGHDGGGEENDASPRR